ncbi:MAG: tetratricopeptide repeat protein [Phycisphaerales bacterium]|nr:tetratricopeptide repeat protein [Phycisphaerales bacterium]
MTISETYAAAVTHLRAGRLAAAEELFNQIVRDQPNHSGACHLLGIVAFQTNRLDAAVDRVQQAIRLNPSHHEYHSNLSVIFAALRRWPESLTHAQRSVSLKSNFPEAHVNLGKALRATHQFVAAETAFRKALALRPNDPNALLDLGLTLKEQGHLQKSVETYRQALSFRPNFPEALVCLGGALLELHQPTQALALFQKALALNPNSSETWIALATAYKVLENLQAYADAIRNVVRLQPQSADAHNTLGIAFYDLHRADDAIASYRRAIALDPNHTGALNNLGLALKDAGQLDEALAAHRRARDLGITKNAPDAKDHHSNFCYTLHFHPNYSPAQILAEHRDWNARYAAPLKSTIQPHTNDRSPDRRLRIGYVSADFTAHVVGFNLLPLFQHHNHGGGEQFEIFCYSDVRFPGQITARFQSYADHFRPVVHLSDEQLAQSIRNDRIDILVDLALHMANNRLLVFARKPAPIQMTFAGYPATTGLDAIDYRLTDPYLDPPDGSTDAHHSEKNLRLAQSFWCYDPDPQFILPINPLPALTASGKGGGLTFGCFNNFCKVTPPTLDLWAAVLRALPTSRLLILAPQTQYRASILRHFESQGVTPTRIEFINQQLRRDYLALYHRVDLCLDTFPYNGHTTGLDGLFMGVPTITLIGQTTVSRAGFSQLSNLNLTELAATTTTQFLQIIIDLANDLPRLAALRQSLRARMQASPLMNPQLFATSIEIAYRQAWHMLCNTHPLLSH